ncbi:hypothetical protein PTKIN_Ptkin13bG0007000 [Pterospermum kingtungense]
MDYIRARMHFDNCLAVDCVGKSGGLAILWMHLGLGNDLPWMCIGDYNELISSDEKLGGAIRSKNQIKGSRQAITECNMLDVPYSGPMFTWYQGRGRDVKMETGHYQGEYGTNRPHTRIVIE